MNLVQSYLRLAGPYADALGLRWAVDDYFLEHAGDMWPERPRTFAFAEEIATFLEGFASQRPLIAFEFAVHLLALLRRRLPGDALARARLAQHFYEAGGSLRDAGAFCAQLSTGIPDALEADAVADICQRLRRRDVTIRWFMVEPHGAPEDAGRAPKVLPPLDPSAFEGHVLKNLERFSDEDIRSWLKEGRGPIKDAAQALAKEIPLHLPGRLDGVLDRPRLRNARRYVTRLTGALALPPRRLTDRDLPQGGFADVTTRGKIEQILPSQFALEEWDFFRRYAERELLYFRREDPHTTTRQDLVVLLDQGVRTWGDVRLVLSAAVVALARQAGRRRMSFFLATSGSPRPVDPLSITEDELGRLMEASDLSPSPALALESVLEQPANRPRDIVLLTQPRNLAEADVRTAARRLRPGARLFALTLDRDGQAELREMRRGAALPVRQFHVDFAAPEAPEPPPTEPSAAITTGGWSGPLEPLGFPFKFGIEGRVAAGAFDFDGREHFLLTASAHGMLHLWESTSGALREVVPRAMYEARPVAEVSSIQGTPDGFVVVGWLGKQWGAIHYQLAQRRVRIYPLGTSQKYVNFEYSRAHHCFLALCEKNQGGASIDLDTGERFATNVGGGSSRAKSAWEAWERREVPRRRFPFQHEFDDFLQPAWLDRRSGQIDLRQPARWSAFTPLADGKPLLQDYVATEGQLGGACLALRVAHYQQPNNNHLYVFRRDGVPIYQTSLRNNDVGFRLSPSGVHLAMQTTHGVAFGPIPTQTAFARTRVGGFAQNTRFYLGDDELIIFPGTRELLHRLSWANGKFVRVTEVYGGRGKLPQGVAAYATHTLPKPVTYDRQRWLAGAQRKLSVACDRFGHVAVFDGRDRLVCMFLAFRNRLAGWLPDGTYFGPPVLTGKPSDNEAAAKFGQALWQASQ